MLLLIVTGLLFYLSTIRGAYHNDEASAYFNIGEKKLRKIAADNLDTGFIIQNGVKFLIKRKQFEDFLGALTAI